MSKKRKMTYIERLFAEMYLELKSLRELAETNEKRITDVYSLTIPEDGGTQTFDSGTTEINLQMGVITNPDRTIETLIRALDAYLPKDLLHSVSISSNKELKFKLDSGTYYTVKAYGTVNLPNVTYRNITIICTEETEVSLFCSTNPGAVISDNRISTIPVGSQGEPFSQCEHNKMRTLDVFHYQIEHGDRDTKVGYMTDINEAAFVVLANAVYTQPSDDMQMEVVSDSVEDDVGGIGAEHLRITYFSKDPWTKHTTDIIMDGTTEVDTTATDMYRIETIEVIKGNPAVGTITLKDTSGATLYGQINPLRTYMERAIHYIETGKRCVATDFVVSTQTKEGIIFRIFKTNVFGTDLVPSGRYSATILETVLPQSFNVPVVIENPDGLRMAIGFAVLGLAAAQGGTGSFRYYDEDI